MDQKQLQLHGQEREFIQALLESIITTVKENPQLLAAAIPALTSFSLSEILNALGFASTGAVPGSLAAAWQSSIGTVLTGQLLSLVQSISVTSGVPVIGAGTGIGLVAAVSIVAIYIVNNELSKNAELRETIEQEIRGLGQAAAATAMSVGINVCRYVSSPAVQARVEDVRVAAGAVVQNVLGVVGGYM